MYIRFQIWLLFGLLIGTSLLYQPHMIYAHSSTQEMSVLVVYASNEEEVNEHQRMIDMLVGHFTTKIKFVPSSQLTESDLQGMDYLIFDGQERERLSRTTRTLISEFPGPIIAIGYNTEQLEDRFSFIEIGSHPVVIDQVINMKDQDQRLSFVPQTIKQIKLREDQDTSMLLLGKQDHQLFPLAVNHQSDYYFATTVVRQPFSLLLAELLHDVFDEPHHDKSVSGYIRLEDIHPFVDPKPLKEIADILAEKNIPYMIAVIPVYTNPITKKQYHFSDSPKLLKVLKYMQDHGGSIVLHGYTHQFRLSETGEGFEFWDVEYNMPIYHGPDDNVIIKTAEDFSHLSEYEAYLDEQKAFERAYTEERLKKGIEELTNYGLYPLVFEAPHYTMSQQGYEIVADYFTTYVGQLQLSDLNWEIMTSAPYITKPTTLHGMTLLPETIGYVDPENPNAIEEMMQKARDVLFVRDGMIAGFYHPYLGVERFKQLLSELEHLREIEWIDLKELDLVTETEHVNIISGNGEISVEVDHIKIYLSSVDYFLYHLKNIIHYIFWGMASLGMIATIYFLYCIVRQRQTEEHEWRKRVG